MLEMIKTFASKETEKLFQRESSRKIPQAIQQIARRKLEILDAAEVLQDLRIPPWNHLVLWVFWEILDQSSGALDKEVHVYTAAI